MKKFCSADIFRFYGGFQDLFDLIDGIDLSGMLHYYPSNPCKSVKNSAQSVSQCSKKSKSFPYVSSIVQAAAIAMANRIAPVTQAANVFASEVLFQLDTFRDRAEGEKFEIWTPVRLAKDFGASNYAAIRQYVSKNHRSCAVIVLNKPELVEGDGFRATLRRSIQSQRFTETFGQYAWKSVYTPDDKIGAFIPLGKRRSSGKRTLSLTDLNGDRHECIGESFFTGHQVFILIHVTKALSAKRVFIIL